MKIACIGNMNNNMFCIVRYLRDMGYDANLFLVHEQDLFIPSGDSFNDDYLAYTHQLDWYDIWHWNISVEKIKKDLDGFNFIMACDQVPAFLGKANIHIDLLVVAGSEIYQWPFYNIPRRFPKISDLGNYYFTYCFRKAVRNSSYINFGLGNKLHEEKYKKLNPKAQRITTNPPFLYITQYSKNYFKQPEYLEEIENIRKSYDFIIIQHCRQSWFSVSKTKKSNFLAHKANDILIKGFADFLSKIDYKKNNLLILFEYGVDVDASKKLIEELGIQSYVKWLPKMYRKDLMIWLQIADLGVGELGDSWFSYGAVYEFLSLKVPFIGNRNDEDFKHLESGLYPMISAPSIEKMSATFLDYKNRPEYYKEMGIKAFEWFNKYAIEKPLEVYKKMLEEKSKLLKLLIN